MMQEKNMRFLPGGFEEATITNCEKDKIYIKKRKGFIKYSLQYGYTVYPCYTFNENKIFNTINIFEGFRLWINKFKIPGAIFFGKYLYMPRNDIELITVIGKGIEFPTILKPTKEDIGKYHKLYIQNLKELYDKYKVQFNSSDELEIL